MKITDISYTSTSGTNLKYRTPWRLSCAGVTFGNLSWLCWIIAYASPWLIKPSGIMTEGLMGSTSVDCYKINSKGIYCRPPYTYDTWTTLCCPNNNTIACCDPVNSPKPSWTTQTSYTEFLSLLKACLILSLFSWIIQIVLVWWQNLSYGDPTNCCCCGCCCGKICLNRERNCCGRKRKCFNKKFYMLNRFFSAVLFFQMLEVLLKTINFIIGLYIIAKFESNGTIKLLRSYGGEVRAGMDFAIIGILADTTCLLCVIGTIPYSFFLKN